ncbi:MAG: protein kinase [Synechococcales cyanobacterium M58_A2018_015]|nr:protein kinase [Synechococcales cyanobacterium M58_A2018_015]
MSQVYCRRGHANPDSNHYCSTCGEKLNPSPNFAQTGQPSGTAASPAITPGQWLGGRYRVMQELGHGGFGRTYLAEDNNRFNELCVLKEFAPQVRGTYALQKAEELFEREAGVLYQLRHPQIPRFRELFRDTVGDRGQLFLVQDYVEGRTYRQLLAARQQQGLAFSELEMRQFLEQLLPVLDYIHRAGVIHRDISPDNLILRSLDQQPVLIDFGGVKQVAAAATSMYMTPETAPPAATRLGKLGYAPEEQMQQGIISPQSDLYALAMTVLVLLTGTDPLQIIQALPDFTRGQWLDLDSSLRQVLSRMLAPQPGDRYPSAQAVLQALRGNSFNPGSSTLLSPMAAHSTLPPQPDPAHYAQPIAYTLPESATQVSAQSGSQPDLLAMPQPAPPATSAVGLAAPHSLPPVTATRRGWGPLFLLVLLLAGLGGVGWGLRDRWLPQTSPPSEDFPSEAPDTSLESRSQDLGVDFQFLIRLTNETFYQRYPEQQGRELSEDPNDAEWRARWSAIAQEWLQILEQYLSLESRQRLGTYGEVDRREWRQTVNQFYVGSRSLFDLTDAQFFQLFPEQRDANFIDQPIGQVWQALAADQVTALAEGKTREELQFAPGAFSEQVSYTLAPGTGRVYTANLAQGQIMRLNLQAPPDSTQLSIYLPRPTPDLPSLLEDAPDTTWSGSLPQSGYYELVVINASSQPIRYQLTVAVDNVTAPAAPQPSDAKE